MLGAISNHALLISASHARVAANYHGFTHEGESAI